jgi:N-dimethylarginine dimethylaminohydrolase
MRHLKILTSKKGLVVEFFQRTMSTTSRSAARLFTGLASGRCLRSVLLVLLAAIGFGSVAISGQGYQPYRSGQTKLRNERLLPPYEEDGQTSQDGEYREAPFYSRRRPAQNQLDDEQRDQPTSPRREPTTDPDADDADVPPAAPRESSWQAAPNRQNRRFVKPAPASSTDGLESTAGLVADDGGPIAELLLHYAVNSEGELGAVYHDLFQKLGPSVQLQVCCPNEASVEAFSSRWGNAAVGQGRQVQVVNVNRPITVWARDRRICRQTADGRAAACFVPTAHFTYDPEKQNDLVLSSLLFPTSLAPAVALSSFHLEGGNVVSNRRHVFVGANAFEDNAHRFPSEAAMFAELTRIFGRTAIPLRSGDGETPWIHADMYLTPIDSRTILVANPAAGCRMLDGRNTITVPHRDRQTQAEFDVLTQDSPRQQRFDDVAAQLTEMGYQVVRMPALMNVQKDWMVTYNNVLMDYQDGQRVVFMPVYHIPELDRAAAQIYRSLGFEVCTVDVSPVFQLGGAIRCLANVTRRVPYESRLEHQDAETRGRLQVYSVDPSANRTREPRPQYQRRPLPPSLRERPQASIQQPVDVAN